MLRGGTSARSQEKGEVGGVRSKLAAAGTAAMGLAFVFALSVGGTAAIAEEGSSDASGGQEATPFSAQNAIGYEAEGGYRADIASLPSIVHDAETNAANAEDNAPARYVDANGFTVQQVPSDSTGYNISYLSADLRGCTTCHSMEDVMLSMDTYHGVTFVGYATEQNFANCFVCHQWATPLRTSIHAIHNFSTTFQGMGGTCESCHYVDDQGDFQRWDYAKYDLYKGITDVAATDEAAAIEATYDQDTITATEDMFYKSIKQYGNTPSMWRTDDSNMDPALYENWVITVGGDVENPIEMTLPELVEKFGTKTVTMKQQCCINGVGNALVYQCEVTGISVKDILEYVNPKDGANGIEMHAEDQYPNVGSFYNMPLSVASDPDTLIVIQVNGETLPNSQGYPAAIWFPRTSAGGQVKVFTGFDVITTDDATAASGYFVGDFTDPATGQPASKPNSAVLNYPTGVVLPFVEGQSVTLEGFADAWDEPIEKVEFSLDHGATWTEMATPDNDPERWTYWRLTFTPPNEGAYLLDIRTTSIMPDGTERVCVWNTQFLLNLDADFVSTEEAE